MEIYPEHFPIELGEGEFRSRMRVLRHHSLRQIAYGVVDFTKHHQKNRAFFEFAKKVGLFSLSADPEPESFESLDKLAEELRSRRALAPDREGLCHRKQVQPRVQDALGPPTNGWKKR